MIIEKPLSKWSVWATTLALALAGAYDYLPQLREVLPSNWYTAAFIIILLARLVQQNKEPKQ